MSTVRRSVAKKRTAVWGGLIAAVFVASLFIACDRGVTTFKLTIEAAPETGGTVEPQGAATHNVGTEVKVTATANEGYRFTGWSGAATDKTPSITVMVRSNQTLTANFEKNIIDNFTDSRDGKTYRTVKIGGKTWMAENLNHATGNSWCYGDNEDNCQKYGRLYDWSAAMSACPDGWRLSTDNDWEDLILSVGGHGVASAKLREAGWYDGTDEFGFSAMGGGYRDSRPNVIFSFGGITNFGVWWTSVESGSHAHYWEIWPSHSGDFVQTRGRTKNDGVSVRCVR